MVTIDASFITAVQKLSTEPVKGCFYCQKCSVGCPTAYAMDLGPAQVIKMVQLGQKERVLKSSAIWLCVGCETCGARCPNGIRINNVMDTLKEMALEGQVAPAEKEVYALHRSFVESIRRFGRVHELSMMLEYKLRTPGKLLNDLAWNLQLFAKGKALHLWKKIRDLDRLKELFQRSGV